VVEPEEMSHLMIDLPMNPDKKRLAIFDMDETLIHCVDDF
jgi:hypothetical protein